MKPTSRLKIKRVLQEVCARYQHRDEADLFMSFEAALREVGIYESYDQFSRLAYFEALRRSAG